ncbi:hypothetical protein OROGR_024836 [Orobanche gracilis]
MFAIFFSRTRRIPLKHCVFQRSGGLKNAVLINSFSSQRSTPSVCENDSEKSFTVSYLITSCGLSSKNAVSVSEKVCFRSPEKPDAVLKLLREYGFTDAHIPRVVAGLPSVLLASPNKNLLPKLEFFRSIGVPLPVLARKLSVQPSVLTRSLENSIIPCYNDLKNLLQSDEKVVQAFTRAPTVFGRYLSEGISSNISLLRERGVPASYIVSLAVCQPELLITNKEKLAVCLDRAFEMGFDISKSAFVIAIRMFATYSESALKQKVEVYRRCGWSESDTIDAFVKFPICMALSEKKIMANMNFLVSELSYTPCAIAQCPVLLGLNLEKRIKPRCLVARILNQNGFLRKMTSSVNTLLKISEKLFLKRYIVKYEKDIPELLDIYQGKILSSPPEMRFQSRSC